ncbi:hypothetical protein F5Y16DRAFT_41130 [Xylariaceae sp. FL0255]|nr:hypothetical protein F5Y16DRAFT_41130 [Xylariaceae sp. FL0255]
MSLAPLCANMHKRKAESHVSERLSKRLSVLNLEKSPQRFYIPVASPHLEPVPDRELPPLSTSSNRDVLKPKPKDNHVRNDEPTPMAIEGREHVVYVDNLDSSDDEDEERGQRSLFIDPKARRIPPSVLASSHDGSLAGHTVNDMQVILYRDACPTSLTVPGERDSVRRAILEARTRMRAKRREDEEEDIPEKEKEEKKDKQTKTDNDKWTTNSTSPSTSSPRPTRYSPSISSPCGMEMDASGTRLIDQNQQTSTDINGFSHHRQPPTANGFSPHINNIHTTVPWQEIPVATYDPDAMDLD